MSKTELKGQATPADISKWKEEHKTGIYFIATDTDIAYFREATRHDVSKALTAANDEKPLAGIEEFGRLCFIGGSEAILKDDAQFLSARMELAKHYKPLAIQTGNL